MAYSELIKNFKNVREYMREFYVYGFKSRNDYSIKSARSYDDEKRRLESWIGEYMKFNKTQDGKNVFISIDSRVLHHNPLYKAWKAKSFTDGDITFHFILFDILYDKEASLSINEISDRMDDYLVDFNNTKVFDISTIRKKLNEYVKEGIIVSEKHGKTMYYRRSDCDYEEDSNILNFFSEVMPCGVIGSYLLDKQDAKRENFLFKHHYITGAMDSEIIYSIFLAMEEKRSITLETVNKNKDKVIEKEVVPLKLMISVQSGRQYLMAYRKSTNRISSFRTDNIISLKIKDEVSNFDELREKLNHMLPNMWGVSTQSRTGKRMEHVEFVVKYREDEKHIHKRLEREKRCGKVEVIDKNTSKFSADVYDSSELIPWIRTFISRIVEFHSSNDDLENQFRNDLEEMYKMYFLGGDLK